MIPGPAAITAEVLAAGARPVLSHSDRRTPCPGYVTDFKNWLPVMESHEGGAPGYLGTPAVTLLAMLHTASGSWPLSRCRPASRATPGSPARSRPASPPSA